MIKSNKREIREFLYFAEQNSSATPSTTSQSAPDSEMSSHGMDPASSTVEPYSEVA